MIVCEMGYGMRCVVGSLPGRDRCREMWFPDMTCTHTPLLIVHDTSKKTIR